MDKFSVPQFRSILPPLSKHLFLDVNHPDLAVFRDIGVSAFMFVQWQGRWMIDRPAKDEPWEHINFYWVYAPEICVESESGKLAAASGELLIVPSWFDRRMNIDNNSCPHLYVRCDKPELFPHCRSVGKSPFIRGHEMYRDFIRLHKALTSGSGSRRYRQNLAELLTAQFLEEISETEKSDDFKSKLLAQFAGRQRIAVPELAHKMNMSESALYKKCVAFCGQSPQQLILENLFRQAQLYLNYTNYSLRDIAKLMGYSDVFAFSKAFHKFTGISPSEYRKKEPR